MIGSYLDYDSRVNFNAVVTIHDAAVNRIDCRSHNFFVVVNRIQALLDNLRESHDVHVRLCHIRKLFHYLSTTPDLSVFSSNQTLRTGIRHCAVRFSQSIAYKVTGFELAWEDYGDTLVMAEEVVRRIDNIPLKTGCKSMRFEAS